MVMAAFPVTVAVVRLFPAFPPPETYIFTAASPDMVTLVLPVTLAVLSEAYASPPAVNTVVHNTAGEDNLRALYISVS